MPAAGAAFDPGIEATDSFGLPTRPAVALSDGRLAFLDYFGSGFTPGQSVAAAPYDRIEVLSIATDKPVAAVEITPDNDVLGIALNGATLAWVEEPVAVELGQPTTNPLLPTCSFADAPTGPPVLETAQLAELAGPVITVGSSPPAVPCTQAPPPP